MAAPPPPPPQLVQELGRYLVRHHARQQELPVDVGTFHRRIQRRCGKDPLRLREQQQAYPALCAASPEALLGAVLQLAEQRCATVERLTAGPKTLTMLTWVGEAELLARLGGGEEGPAGTVESERAAKEPAGEASTDASGTSEDALPRPKKPRTDASTAAPLAASQPTQPTQPTQTVADILGKPTALEALAAERFKKHTPVVREFCAHRTKTECDAYRRVTTTSSSSGGQPAARCDKLHFRRVIESHTDVGLGDCAYLSSCRRTRTCKYIHYAIEDEPGAPTEATERPGATAAAAAAAAAAAITTTATATAPAPKAPAQWVNTDVREFDLSVLGQFDVIMADPPWEIHMDLPYATMKDDEVCKLNFPKLQERDGGLLFLWVTGRAMERAREVFAFWGYRQVEEIVWIKTNQLQKVVRTGRTGHWLNHSKEHCLVGVKGQPRGLNRYLDCDVIVAEARETSRKPDEIYDIIERLSPGTRKVEIFGRRHNIRDGWVTVGNQLPPTRLVEPDVVVRYQAWQAAQRQGPG